MSKVLTVIGTRPEAIKMGPVLRALATGGRFECRLCLTGQHREILDRRSLPQAADYELDIAEGELTEFAAAAIRGVGRVLRTWKPDVVLVQGDTTSAFAGAVAAFYEGVPMGHVEAGLRTGDLRSPWPEEGHRQAIDRLATWMFAPTTGARDRLIAEGASAAQVHVVGNTSIDALRLARRSATPPNGERLVLATVHRRENHGEPLRGICRAIAQVARRWADVRLVMPLHPNPEVRGPVSALLAGLPNVALVEPLDHSSMVALLHRSVFLLTDSGGLQEEAPYLGKPVLVLRSATERREGIEAGTARLVGCATDRIVAACAELLENDAVLSSMSRVHAPYGDGFAAERIVGLLGAALDAEPPRRTLW